MEKKSNVEFVSDLAGLLAGFNPSLAIDAFNTFMMQPDLPGDIAPQFRDDAKKQDDPVPE